MGRSSAFLVDFCLFGARGVLRFRTSFLWNERPGQTEAWIIYIGRRSGMIVTEILKRDGLEGALHACAVAVDIWVA